MEQKKETAFLEKYASAAHFVCLKDEEKEAILASLTQEIKGHPVRCYAAENEEKNIIAKYSEMLRNLLTHAFTLEA
jgi:hypothetical protein